jgi:HAD superfamily hydrolase (TIGR01509 family)
MADGLLRRSSTNDEGDARVGRYRTRSRSPGTRVVVELFDGLGVASGRVGSKMSGPIQGVVFDFGGVVRRPQPAFFARVAQYGLTRNDVMAFFMGPDAVEAQMAGRTFGIADMIPTVERALAPVLGEKAHEAAEAVLSVYIDPDPLAWDQSMVQLLEELHGAGFRIGLLVNGPAEVEGAHFARLIDRSVDATVLSGRDGVGKPMAQAYELIAERLGLRPEQCFFVDDNAHNVEAARTVGMPSWHYTADTPLLVAALRSAGIDW